jgi:ketosteroid isomerase-like protein
MTETQKIRQRIAAYAAAISVKDIDKVMSFFAPDMISFDLEPPLRYAGAENKRRRWLSGFAAYTSIAYEVSELTVTANDDLAFIHALNRFQGMQSSGQATDLWVRWTACLRRIDDTWLVVHDHVSVPVNLGNGQAALNLAP